MQQNFRNDAKETLTLSGDLSAVNNGYNNGMVDTKYVETNQNPGHTSQYYYQNPLESQPRGMTTEYRNKQVSTQRDQKQRPADTKSPS